jgi:hypothetical protein
VKGKTKGYNYSAHMSMTHIDFLNYLLLITVVIIVDIIMKS